MKHEYETLCDVKLETMETKAALSKSSQLFHWFSSQGNDADQSLEFEL